MIFFDYAKDSIRLSTRWNEFDFTYFIDSEYKSNYL